MGYLVYNRLPPAPKKDTSLVGEYVGKTPPDRGSFPELGITYEDAVPSYSFEERTPGVFILDVESRSKRGKTACRHYRQQGLVPGILFGGGEKQQARLICAPTGKLCSLLENRGFMGFQYELNIKCEHDPDTIIETVLVEPHVCHLDPATDNPVAVTFHRVEESPPPPKRLSFNERYPSAYDALKAKYRQEAFKKVKRQPPQKHRLIFSATKKNIKRRQKYIKIDVFHSKKLKRTHQ
eukprot:CAMPEP_0201545576 /NCGR_PEP_ID=MMETSP0173_2-20130828/2047_1 /ASSEMBLY_ACC=CAM_ASM_000268 /TAXON_ID=218659 /ORGANISM="Vexillifera sp., Strain DIVA3 564/2" /LENGTH=236 /DNA_ID=CAMNT_0047954001 /DNA_START=27 /DNA_END=740 /DNA_ORIENTATION=+